MLKSIASACRLSHPPIVGEIKAMCSFFQVQLLLRTCCDCGPMRGTGLGIPNTVSEKFALSVLRNMSVVITTLPPHTLTKSENVSCVFTDVPLGLRQKIMWLSHVCNKLLRSHSLRSDARVPVGLETE